MLIGYDRVSTIDQNPPLQLDALRDADCERVVTETASGAQRDRPKLKAALDFMRAGDTIAMWRLDRLARSVRQLIETAEDLDDRGIEFRSQTENIDASTPNGVLVFHLSSALSEFERSVNRTRARAGLAAARARGLTGGRPPALKETDRAAVVALLRDPDIPVKEIAKRLGLSVAALYHHYQGGRGAVPASAVGFGGERQDVQ